MFLFQICRPMWKWIVLYRTNADIIDSNQIITTTTVASLITFSASNDIWIALCCSDFTLSFSHSTLFVFCLFKHICKPCGIYIWLKTTFVSLLLCRRFRFLIANQQKKEMIPLPMNRRQSDDWVAHSKRACHRSDHRRYSFLSVGHEVKLATSAAPTTSTSSSTAAASTSTRSTIHHHCSNPLMSPSRRRPLPLRPLVGGGLSQLILLTILLVGFCQGKKKRENFDSNE